MPYIPRRVILSSGVLIGGVACLLSAFCFLKNSSQYEEYGRWISFIGKLCSSSAFTGKILDLS